jgi:uncharacterized membrane protein
MLPTKFRFIWPSGFREDFLKSANQKQELPVVAMVREGLNVKVSRLQLSVHVNLATMVRDVLNVVGRFTCTLSCKLLTFAFSTSLTIVARFTGTLSCKLLTFTFSTFLTIVGRFTGTLSCKLLTFTFSTSLTM